MSAPADPRSPDVGRDPVGIAAMDATAAWLAERRARNQFIDEHGDLETGFYLGNLHARRAPSAETERLREALRDLYESCDPDRLDQGLCDRIDALLERTT